MEFVVAGPGNQVDLQGRHAVLYVDNWDDWRKYRTMFTLVVIDDEGDSHRIGSVKIGQQGLRPGNAVAPGQRAPELPERFACLSDSYFSLGQGEDYYAALNQLGQELRVEILSRLRDCAADLGILEQNLEEEVMRESLLRSVGSDTVRNRLHRLTQGDAALTPFRFRCTMEQPEQLEPAVLEFEVEPESEPPTNIHVLIGRNGVGKTQCMRRLVKALLGRGPAEGELGITVESMAIFEEQPEFAGIVLVSFSAFDDFDLEARTEDRIGSVQVGLRQKVDGVVSIKSPGDLARDFRLSLSRCRQGLKAKRWKEALNTLASDELFAEANASELITTDVDHAEWGERVEAFFARLSSGHKIVLLTITKLVELVDEKTLVLIDEPEGHLHPPLLSAFVRCLSNLLVQRNGVAIIATHSPVVLQEVPRNCAWKLRRSRSVLVTERPVVETFGENIGLLTREVFGFEVTRSGFHGVLSAYIERGFDVERVTRRLSGQLGVEAKAILRSLDAQRRGGEQ